MCSIVQDLGSASTAEVVEATGQLAARLAEREAPDSGMAALELAEALGKALDVLEAGLAHLVGRVDDRGTFAELGFSSTGAWLRTRLGMRDGRAAERVRLARQLPRLTKVAEKLAGGALSLGYAGAIADAVARLDDLDAQVGEDLLLGMIDAGHTAGQIAKDGAEITDLINQHRGKEKEPEESKRGFSRSWMNRSKSLDGGSWVKAWLSPEHSATFEQIIGPMAKPKARGDDRDLAQRTADALMSVISGGNKSAGVTVIVDLAAYTAATGDTGPFDFARQAGARQGGAAAEDDPADPADLIDRGERGERGERKCGVQAWDTEDERNGRDKSGDHRESTRQGEQCGARWNGHQKPDEGGCRNRQDPREPGRPPDNTPGDDHPETALAGWARATSCLRPDSPGHGHKLGLGRAGPARERAGRRAAARLLTGARISPERARQIALNAGVNVLILGRSGQPLYLGRTVRFATPAQRKALLAVYDTCCVEGCQIPAHSCEIHHLDGGWKLATPTDIDKLAPACGWHNRWVETHADQVRQTRDRHGRAVLRILAPWERQNPAPNR